MIPITTNINVNTTPSKKHMRFRKTTGARISLDSAWSKDAFAGGPGDGAGGARGDLARGDAALRLAAEFGIGGLVFDCTSIHAPFCSSQQNTELRSGPAAGAHSAASLQPLQPQPA
jgi:hypothetical protein